MRQEATVMECIQRDEESNYWIRSHTGDKKLEDEYILGDMIGRGVSSVVYKCLRKGRSEWACKILKKSLLDKKSVQRDIKTLLKLKHPNLVQLRDAFETDDEIQLILELAQGGELFERIVGRGYFTEEDAARAVRHVLNALQYLHSNGIIHQSLKPENILYLSEDDGSLLKLGDFGMSNIFTADTLAASRTLGLYAPEIIENKEIDSSVDLWSLGVVMYIMLCGFEPFLNDNNPVDDDCSFPSPWWDKVSDGAKELISKLLSADPKSRPTAVEALNHPWILGISTSTLNMNETIERLKEFNAKRRFRVATTAVIATRRALKYLPGRKHKDSNTDGGGSTEFLTGDTTVRSSGSKDTESNGNDRLPPDDANISNSQNSGGSMKKFSVDGGGIEEKSSSSSSSSSIPQKDGYAPDS